MIAALPPVTDHFDYESALAGCATRDTAALRRLYEHAAPYLLGVAMRIVRDRATAEDVLHDAFVKVWKHAHTFDPARGTGRGWLFSLVRHQALNVVRGRLRLILPDEEMAQSIENDTALAGAASVASAGETRVMMSRLAICLDELDASKRDCILYAYVDGCSHGEIAARLGAPLGSVKAWVRRGLQALKECMQ